MGLKDPKKKNKTPPKQMFTITILYLCHSKLVHMYMYKKVKESLSCMYLKACVYNRCFKAV